MLRVALCDDESVQIQSILNLMESYQKLRPALELSAEEFDSGAELLERLDTGGSFDIYLLDILMPGLNGIDLARDLRRRGERAPLIFLTSSADHALDAFDVDAAQYILKPVKEDKLFAALDMTVRLIEKEKESDLFVSTPEGIVKVSLSSIVCVESINRSIQVYLTNGRTVCSKVIRAPFDKVAEVLFNDPGFISTHKSFILNMEQVYKLTPTSFVMKTGFEVPVPRYRHKEAKSAYLEYLSKQGASKAGGK